MDECRRAEQSGSVQDAARQEAVFDSAVDFAIILTDPAGTITGWNSAAVHVMGWSTEEMFGESVARIYTAQDRDDGLVESEMQQAIEFGYASNERWHLRKDGRSIWVSGETMPLYSEKHAHLGFMTILRDRTKEHLDSRAMEETKERYRLAAKATNDAIWDWDLAANQVLWNDALADAYGYSLLASETSSDWWLEHIHPDDKKRIYNSIHAVIDGDGNSWSEEYRFRRNDGSYAEVLDRGHVIRDADGKALRMIGAMLDLTSRRKSETALRKSEERFRTIVETIETAFAIVEVKFDAQDHPVDYRFIEVNPAFEREAGIDLRDKWVTEYAPELEQFWFDTYGHVAKTREPLAFESYANTFERWFDVKAVPVGDPTERQLGIFFNDVTARRNAQERLKASEALAHENIERVQLALAAGAIIGTWHWHVPTDRFTVDKAFAEAFGLDPALGFKGLSLEQIIATVHPDDREGMISAIDDVIARGGAFSHQYRVRRADQRYYWIEANGRVELADDGTAQNFPGVLINVEERRALMDERDRATAALRALNDTLEQRVAERTTELMQAEEKLRQSQKMEAVGQLTGGLAHDFNNLLAGISGSLEMMSVRIAQGRLGELEKYILTAQGASRRAAALTHRLLAFSRRQTLDPRPTDVNALLLGMTELIQRTVGPSITLETLGTAELWPVKVDSSQLENALLNLCINARDAMPDGGRITIQTANRWMDREVARTHDLTEGQYLALSVTDTGFGMAPDVIAKAFDPFFTTKPIGHGTGLGLSMIYGFAKQSGGQARIHSKVGVGTTLTIYLPRYFGSVDAEREELYSNAVELSELGETILVVDDEPTIRMLLVDALSERGYSVIEAADSVAGLKMLRSDVHIDLLISDVGLPGGMNGRQMADAGRELRPGLKTLFITGYAANAAVGNGQLQPGMQVITKPFSVDSLITRVQELMAAE
ncbi:MULTISPECIES: hybrid sensor histidine kinase/response regulator [unclassified Pseudomonas]|uniref:PAS domain-containing hybrid sensor histidine kinase/response regulator n=1 Tax=unclassified Pseudomonas TaxID=196821 RepID=UPI0023B96114|nr:MULTISPECIES: hybrid sensor histidine kinase/response regulator [unclassified Pseudomonas]